MKVLIRLYATHRDRRGLGDCVQFTIVLQHLKAEHPNWELYTETTHGKESCFLGLVQHTYNPDGFPSNEKDFDKVINLKFPEPGERNCELCVLHQFPATKTLTTIIDDLQIHPRRDLFNYKINIPEKIKMMVKAYLNTLPINKGLITLHYRASSSTHNKDIDEKDMQKVCNSLVENGFTPLILDWKGTGIPDQKKIFLPEKTNSIWMGKPYGDAAVIAAIIHYSNLFVGVDSGPLHLAGATQTPTVGYWKYHHPVHFFDFAKNVTHMTPTDHLRFIKTHSKSGVDDFFQRNYNHRWYSSNNRGNSILDTIYEALNYKFPEKKVFEPVQKYNRDVWWPIKVKE